MILIVAEHRDGRLRPVTAEMVGLALPMGRELGLGVAAVVAGPEVGEMAATLASWQLDRVFSVQVPEGGDPLGFEQTLEIVANLIRSESPAFVIGPHTSEGMEFMPRLAVRFSGPLIPGCTGFELQGERVLFTRPVFGARFGLRVSPRTPEAPCFLTVAPGSCPAAEPEAGAGVAPEAFEVDLSGVTVRRRVGLEEAPRGEVPLDSAEVIVAVGRGIQKAENLQVAADLADALGAPLGASRPVVDAGWLPRDRQIGSSGQTVSPRLYIALGISGAVQHLVGMQSARCIVAINRDPEAPVYRVAHYGIALDMFEVVPELARTIR
jgi:electron transfer flavoprotein alpha subunit